MNDVKNITRQQAIDAMCHDCVTEARVISGDWRLATENCFYRQACSLWPFRPTTKDKNDGE